MYHSYVAPKQSLAVISAVRYGVARSNGPTPIETKGVLTPPPTAVLLSPSQI